MVILTALIVGGIFGVVALALLVAGQRSGDDPSDPRSVVEIKPSWSTDEATVTCRVTITNPGQSVAIASMDARWSSVLGPLFLGVHDRRYATGRDRRRAETLDTSHIGSVPPGDEALWELPLPTRAGAVRTAVTVVVLVSGGGQRVLRQIHRIALRDTRLNTTPGGPTA
jgi:hypothetical protein